MREFSPKEVWRDQCADFEIVIDEIIEGLGGDIPLDADLRAKAIYDNAFRMETSGDLPDDVTADDVYDHYAGYSDCTDR